MEAQRVAVPVLARPRGLAAGVRAVRRKAFRFITRQPTGTAGLLMVVVIFVMAFFAPWLERYDPLWQDYKEARIAPGLTHFMGTDEYGRDLWARVVGGARLALMVGVVSVLTGSLFGLFAGIVSGYVGGGTDNIIQRLTEVMLAFPSLLLALAVMATLGSGVDKVIIAISISFIPRTVRVMRGTTLSIKENVYIDAVRTIGASPMRIMVRHVLPNVMAPYLIIASSLLGTAILTEATLSFLGLGIPPPHPSWGRMLSQSVAMYAVSAPWMVIFPGLAITWLVLGFNLFGDTLRDIWDPRLRGRS
ncbi:MAG: ABC transporter permease [Chloroflexi bacterium]|nr:ABC transporter permease [Chloroflexota bacterium]